MTGKRSVKGQGWENAILQIGSPICYFNLELWNRREMKSRQCTFLYHLPSSFLLRKSTSLVFIPISHPLSPPPFSVVLPNRRVHRIFQRGGGVIDMPIWRTHAWRARFFLPNTIEKLRFGFYHPPPVYAVASSSCTFGWVTIYIPFPSHQFNLQPP